MNDQASGESRTLRSVVADAIEVGIRQQEEGWDACETCLGRVADVVLDAIEGHEQNGGSTDGR